MRYIDTIHGRVRVARRGAYVETAWPEGWTPELDRAEEHQSLTELALARAVRKETAAQIVARTEGVDRERFSRPGQGDTRRLRRVRTDQGTPRVGRELPESRAHSLARHGNHVTGRSSDDRGGAATGPRRREGDAMMSPIPVLIHCPACGHRHVDRDDDTGAWATTRHHRTHLCHGCGHLWTPHPLHTVGVDREPLLSYTEWLLVRRILVDPREVDAATPRAILVGEAPGPNTRADCPVFPYPATSAAGRLVKILGVSPRQYLSTFRRRNLLSAPGAKWTSDARIAARSRAAEIRLESETTNLPLVLLGRNVAAAFGVVSGDDWISPFEALGTRGVVIPHPSGRNRAYNDGERADAARRAVEEVIGV